MSFASGQRYAICSCTMFDPYAMYFMMPPRFKSHCKAWIVCLQGVCGGLRICLRHRVDRVSVLAPDVPDDQVHTVSLQNGQGFLQPVLPVQFGNEDVVDVIVHGIIEPVQNIQAGVKGQLFHRCILLLDLNPPGHSARRRDHTSLIRGSKSSNMCVGRKNISALVPVQAGGIREAMYAAGFGMVEESDKGYNQPAYDTATRQYTVQWTWLLAEPV